MPRRTPALPTALGALLLLAGCATSIPTTPVPIMPTPAPEVELPPARISGYEERSALLDNFTVYVSAIDRVPVTAGREGWGTALTLKAGQRRLTLGFSRGVFAATAEVLLNATSESSYQVRFATDAQFLGKNSYCEFWIVDTATGQPATDRIRAELQRIAPDN